MNQLLYGCQRENCDTPTCYTARKRLSHGTNASRRLTLLSARIIACNLAIQDDPLKALCPGKPVIPTMSADKNRRKPKDSSFREEITDELDDEEKENRRDGADKMVKKGLMDSKEVGVVTDKGLKDSRSFTQQLFNTVAMKMVEWISLPPPRSITTPTGKSEVGGVKPPSAEQPLPSPQEPPKISFSSNPMEIMDTGRLNRDSDAVSERRHREILQQPRRRGLSLNITPTPHTNARAKAKTPVDAFAMGPPPPPPLLPPAGLLGNYHTPHHPRRTTVVPQITPCRGEKNTGTLWEPPEAVLSPQCLKRLDEEICKALVSMHNDAKATHTEKRTAKRFAKQSIFYVFSNPKALLASFGGVGDGEGVGFDPTTIRNVLGILYHNGWEELTKKSMWVGLAGLFAVPGRGMSDKDAAGLLVVALHVLEVGLVKDEEVFRMVAEARSAGRVTSKKGIVPDIGLDNEIAERLMKRVLRGFSWRLSRLRDETISLVGQYVKQCEEQGREERAAQIAREFGSEMVGQVNDGHLKGGCGLARCTLEWTRTVFMKCWDGHEIVQGSGLTAACVEMFEFLHDDYSSYNLFPSVFETPLIGERINPYIWPVDWFNEITRKPSRDLHLLDYQYLLPVRHKVTFFRAINIDIMKKAYETAITNIRMAGQMGELTRVGYPLLASKIDNALSIYLVIAVRRSNLLEDAFNQLIYREHRELMRPLKIRFADGEEGVDQGGVQQEFFSLLMKEILKPEYGVFVTDERTQLSWFWEGSLESTKKFELVGLAMGLAVYNGITLPVSFPKALYIKLLAGTPMLDDVDDYWPELAKGLKELLRWEDGDVGDVFVRTYEYSYEAFGEVYSVNMIKAKEDDMEYLPPPILPLTRKQQKKPKRPAKVKNAAGNWLPDIPRESWLGSLNEVLEDFVRDAENSMWDNQNRQDEDEEHGYIVSYHDLNAETDEEIEDGLEQPAEEASEEPSKEPSEEPRVEDDKTENEQDDSQSQAQTQVQGAEPHQETPADGSESEKSWQTLADEDDLSPTQIALPPDNGQDWDDRSTTYSPSPSPTGSIYARALEAMNGADIPDLSLTDPSRPQSSRSPAADHSTSYRYQSPSRSPSLHYYEDEEAPVVTNANRREFVQDYIAFLTHHSVGRQYAAFSRGFFSILQPRALALFSPSSLRQLIEGSASPIDVAALERITKYEDGYDAQHRVIRDFWSVVRGFPEERKRQLLEFVTSSARVPVGGLEGVMFYIVRNGEDSERLPSSLTCFGRLLLPEYSNRRKLREKLRVALDNARGFGNP
jgi:hypothetical protein